MSSHSTFISTIVSRVQAQCATGKILEGYTFRGYPITEAAGMDDYPAVTVLAFSSDTGQRDRDAVWFKVTVQLQVTTKKTDGMAAHAVAVDKVIDSCFTTAAGAVDIKLASTTIFGVLDNTERTTPSGLGLTSVIQLTGETIPAKIGSQRT